MLNDSFILIFLRAFFFFFSHWAWFGVFLFEIIVKLANLQLVKVVYTWNVWYHTNYSDDIHRHFESVLQSVYALNWNQEATQTLFFYRNNLLRKYTHKPTQNPYVTVHISRIFHRFRGNDSSSSKNVQCLFLRVQHKKRWYINWIGIFFFICRDYTKSFQLHVFGIICEHKV